MNEPHGHDSLLRRHRRRFQHEYSTDGVAREAVEPTLEDRRRRERDQRDDRSLPPDAGPRRLRRVEAEPNRHELARMADPAR